MSKYDQIVNTTYSSILCNELFPYNHITEDQEFVGTIKHMKFDVKSLSNLSFNVFDVNNQDMHGLLNEIDPDNYFTEAVAQRNLMECKYYDEDSFINTVHEHKYNSFSIFHSNIRSYNNNLPAIEV